MILIPSVIIITLLSLVSFIGFGDADAQNQNITGNVEALVNKGLTLQRLGQYQEAIGYYDKALAIDPNHVRALNDKGAALSDLGEYNESIGYLDKALAIEPNNVFALFNKGVALGGLGDLGNYEFLAS